MAISEITKEELLAGVRRAVGIPATSNPSIDDVLLAALVRRNAGVCCPCSHATLRASLLECLQYLSEDRLSLRDEIDSVIGGLIVAGDLLELNDVAIEDSAMRGTWLFAAPPAFVVRPSGSIFLVGIVPDQDAFLPLRFASRVVYEGFARMLVSHPNEDLAAELCEQGLRELSEASWLKAPKRESAEQLLEHYKRCLAWQPPSGPIQDLQILDPARPVTYYRGRWTAPIDHSGTFVAKRPQEFGAPIWCFVALEAGVAIRLLDLPLKKTRWRGCDVAWHLQMAIDSYRHNPQLYRRRFGSDGVRLDFFSPLPEWSQRRLMILGRALPREGSLLSYWVPASEAVVEERFLQEQLWLSYTPDSD